MNSSGRVKTRLVVYIQGEMFLILQLDKLSLIRLREMSHRVVVYSRFKQRIHLKRLL